MLKITLHDSASELRFQLEGRLSGPWVEELRQCWMCAASTVNGRRTVADLHEVDFIDPAGENLLSEMHQAGVEIQAVSPLIQAIVHEACLGRCGTVEEQPQSSDAVFCSDTIGARTRAS